MRKYKMLLFLSFLLSILSAGDPQYVELYMKPIANFYRTSLLVFGKMLLRLQCSLNLQSFQTPKKFKNLKSPLKLRKKIQKQLKAKMQLPLVSSGVDFLFFTSNYIAHSVKSCL